MVITSLTVNIVATKRHRESDGNGDRDKGRQNFVHWRPGVTCMGNYLKRIQLSFMYDCILGIADDDCGVWDGFTSDVSVGVGCNRLIVAMESLIRNFAPRD